MLNTAVHHPIVYSYRLYLYLPPLIVMMLNINTVYLETSLVHIIIIIILISIILTTTFSIYMYVYTTITIHTHIWRRRRPQRRLRGGGGKGRVVPQDIGIGNDNGYSANLVVE